MLLLACQNVSKIQYTNSRGERKPVNLIFLLYKQSNWNNKIGFPKFVRE